MADKLYKYLSKMFQAYSFADLFKDDGSSRLKCLPMLDKGGACTPLGPMLNIVLKFSLAPMGVLAPQLHMLGVIALPPINTSGNFLAHVSA